MKDIVILGESHTRSFSYRKNMLPFFMGSGKTINLDNIKVINKTLNNIILKLNKKECLIFLYIGEPNCRYPVRNNWTPHWDEIQKGIDVKPYIDKKYLQSCIDRYSNINLQDIDFILTPTGAYDPVQPALHYFNTLLKEKFGNKVIDIFSKTVDKNLKTLNEYKAKDWEKDPIHVNSKISQDFLQILKNKNVINNIEDYESNVDGYFGTHLLRMQDKSQFGSYIIKD
jgi:hypothetical protein